MVGCISFVPPAGRPSRVSATRALRLLVHWQYSAPPRDWDVNCKHPVDRSWSVERSSYRQVTVCREVIVYETGDALWGCDYFRPSQSCLIIRHWIQLGAACAQTTVYWRVAGTRGRCRQGKRFKTFHYFRNENINILCKQGSICHQHQ